MSAFKRYQSKVFWGQMASHDLQDDRFAERNDLTRYSFNERVREKEEEEKEEKEEENSTKSENDTDANITAIRVCKSEENIKQNVSRISLICDESLTCHGYVKSRSIRHQTRLSMSNNMNFSTSLSC